MYFIINLFYQSIDQLFWWIWTEICFFLSINFGEFISP